VIEYRWAEGHYDRLSSLATELVDRQVAAIATLGGPGPGLAAKAASKTIPIVFATGGDPVPLGLVASLNRPEGNVTGVSYFTSDLGAKRLGMLHELVPGVSFIAVLINPKNPNAQSVIQHVHEAAAAVGVTVDFFHASSLSEIETAFANLVRKKAGALVISPDALFTSRRFQIVTLATRYVIPAIYSSREYVEVGGLMSYGVNVAEVFRQVGVYTGRILRGEKPSDLPVVQPTKFEFVINLPTARALGFEIPPTLVARADEVIE
jgi:putative ABC transport system substrate-binding protein